MQSFRYLCINKIFTFQCRLNESYLSGTWLTDNSHYYIKGITIIVQGKGFVFREPVARCPVMLKLQIGKTISSLIR